MDQTITQLINLDPARLLKIYWGMDPTITLLFNWNPALKLQPRYGTTKVSVEMKE